MNKSIEALETPNDVPLAETAAKILDAEWMKNLGDSHNTSYGYQYRPDNHEFIFGFKFYPGQPVNILVYERWPVDNINRRGQPSLEIVRAVLDLEKSKIMIGLKDQAITRVDVGRANSLVSRRISTMESHVKNQTFDTTVGAIHELFGEVYSIDELDRAVTTVLHAKLQSFC